MGDLDQSLCFTRQLSCNIHARGVAEPTIHNDRHIDIQNIAIFELFITRNAVANNMIYADTACVLIAPIPNRCRGGPIFGDFTFNQRIQSCRAHTRNDMFRDVIKNTRGNLPCFVHTCKIGLLIKPNAVFRQMSLVTGSHIKPLELCPYLTCNPTSYQSPMI